MLNTSIGILESKLEEYEIKMNKLNQEILKQEAFEKETVKKISKIEGLTQVLMFDLIKNLKVKSDLNYDLKSVYFKNANSGFAVGSDGNVISTTNGGSNWIWSNEFKDENIKSVDFIDNLTGWICTNGTIRKSTNSGFNWVTKFVSSNSINSIKFADHNTGCAVGSNNIFSTTNAGENWSQQASPVNLTSIYFLSSSIAWICGNNGTILKTTNGGIYKWQS